MSLGSMLRAVMHRKWRFLSGVLGLIAFALLAIFQNCSQSARLTLNVGPSQEVLISSTLKDRFCGNNQLNSVDTLNVIFVVDMSGSNTDCAPNLPGYSVPSNQLPATCLAYNGPVRGTTAKTEVSATDPTAERLRIVEDFLRQTCGNANPNSRFAVLGFSREKISMGSCDKDLLKPANDPLLTQQINSLRTVQTNWMNYYYGPYTAAWNNPNYVWSNGPPQPFPNPPMMETNYLTGLDCAKQIIDSKAASLSAADKTKNSYFVMFLTDGLPSDQPFAAADPYNAASFQTRKTSIANLVRSMVDMARIEAKAQTVSVLPIYYGVNALNSLGTLAATARAQVDEMMTAMAAAGETNQPTAVQNVGDIRLCELMSSGRRTQTDVLRFGVVNLTARLVNGKLMADSDMDGFTDEEELQYGFDPAHARSDLPRPVPRTQIIDGLCPRGVPYTSCPRIVQCVRPNLTGVGACDLQVFSSEQPTVWIRTRTAYLI